MTGAGLSAALPVRLARVLPGGPARILPGGRQGSCRGVLASPARVLSWRANFPGKGLAGGLVGFFGEDSCYPHLILSILCLHKDLHTTTEVPPEPCPTHLSSIDGLKGGSLRLAWVSCPGKGPCQGNLLCLSDLCGLGPCRCSVCLVASASLRLPFPATSMCGRGGGL